MFVPAVSDGRGGAHFEEFDDFVVGGCGRNEVEAQPPVSRGASVERAHIVPGSLGRGIAGIGFLADFPLRALGMGLEGHAPDGVVEWLFASREGQRRARGSRGLRFLRPMGAKGQNGKY